eukprot:gene36248-43972_t
MLWLLVVVISLCGAIAKEVTISALYPKQLPSLFLRGDGCGLNWDNGVKMDMQQVATGLNATSHFAYTHTVLCPDSTSKLELKVLIDDKQWMIGANHHVNLATVDKVDSLYPYFFTYKGSLSKMTRVYSPELKNYRDVIVYTPPSYNENTVKVHANVLVMHDGQNLFDPKTSAFGTAWMCQDTVDSLIVQGKMDEVVIIGPYNTPDRINEYTYIYDPSEEAGGKGDMYLDFVQNTLLPQSLTNYRIAITRDKLGILGSSLGGLISCYAGWTRPSVYGKVGCMSSSFWWDANDYQKNVITASFPKDKPIFYMDSGTRGGEESCAVYTAQIYDYYVAGGYIAEKEVMKYVDQGAEHNEESWGGRFYVPMQFLFPADTV